MLKSSAQSQRCASLGTLSHCEETLSILNGMSGKKPRPRMMSTACQHGAIIMQVMDALPDWIGELEVRLGHRALLEAALVNARVPKVGLFFDQLRLSVNA